mmetsp:Transcript_48666/g.81239  ORF Transcript_48666/g.81239 Transcript_48666/m.81239 type:complete len:210 (+) Transcript_48666:296-925(+)
MHHPDGLADHRGVEVGHALQLGRLADDGHQHARGLDVAGEAVRERLGQRRVQRADRRADQQGRVVGADAELGGQRGRRRLQLGQPFAGLLVAQRERDGLALGIETQRLAVHAQVPQRGNRPFALDRAAEHHGGRFEQGRHLGGFGAHAGGAAGFTSHAGSLANVQSRALSAARPAHRPPRRSGGRRARRGSRSPAPRAAPGRAALPMPA